MAKSLKDVLALLGKPKNKGQYPALSEVEYNIIHTYFTDQKFLAVFKPILERMESGKFTDKDRRMLSLVLLRWAFAPLGRRKEGVFSPSEFSTELVPCKRKMYYKWAKMPKDPTFMPFTSDNRMQRLVDLGTFIHLYIQSDLEKVGVLIDLEIPVVDKQHGIQGSCDGAIVMNGIDSYGTLYVDEEMTLELKSINTFGFSRLTAPKEEHIKQASIYSEILGYSKICFIYYDKNTSDLKIFVVPNNKEFVEFYRYCAKEVIALYSTNLRTSRSTEVVDHPVQYERQCSSINDDKAQNCPYAVSCFRAVDGTKKQM